MRRRAAAGPALILALCLPVAGVALAEQHTAPAPSSASSRQTIPPDPRPIVECLQGPGRPDCFTRTAPR